MSLPLTQPPRSICIIRLSALGDVSHMLPVIHTLQASWPNCKITWIIGKLEAQLVSDLDNVEFIIFDKSTGLKGLLNLHKQLKYRDFDVLLHMQVAFRASLISLMVKTPIKLGFDKARAHDYQWLFTNQRIVATPKQHVLDGFFGFLKTLGIEKRELRWEIPIPQDAYSYIDQQLQPTKNILVINACSSTRLRNWRSLQPEKYAAIADYAIQKHGMQVVLSGGPASNELDMANAIMRCSQQSLLNLVGQTSIKQMLALLERAMVVIAPDTGPAHMANAVGTTVIGLYASSNPLRTGPYSNQQHLINRYPQALQHYKHKTLDQAAWGERIRDPNCMSLITLSDMQTALDKAVTAGINSHSPG